MAVWNDEVSFWCIARVVLSCMRVYACVCVCVRVFQGLSKGVQRFFRLDDELNFTCT